MSDTLQQDLKNASAEAERTGTLPTDEQGRTALDRAARILSPNQLAKGRRVIEESIGRFRASAPLSNMSEDEASQHLDSIAPSEKAQESGFAAAAKIQEQAWKNWSKIKEIRDKDPVSAIMGTIVKGSPGNSLTVNESGEVVVRQTEDSDFRVAPAKEVVNALAMIEAAQKQAKSVGANEALFTALRTDPIAARTMLIEARLQAQQRLLPGEGYKHRIVSREEADKILNMPKGIDIESREYRDKLRAAADRAEQMYGPKYGQRAFHEAIAFRLKKDEDIRAADQVFARALGNAATGQRVDWRDAALRAKNLEEIDAVGRAFEGQGQFAPAMGDPGRPAIMPDRDTMSGVSSYQERTARGVEGFVPDKTQPGPSEEDLAWVMQNPSARQKRFDERFGEGAYAREVAKQKR